MFSFNQIKKNSSGYVKIYITEAHNYYHQIKLLKVHIPDKLLITKFRRSELMSNGANLEVVEKKLLEIQLNMKKMDKEVKTSMKQIEDDVEEIIHLLNLETAKTQGEGFKPSLLLDFPDHLRKTVKTLLELGVASAKEVSEKTGRSRSLESTYLNSLVTMGYAKRERKGQILYYQIQFDKAKKILGEGI